MMALKQREKSYKAVWDSAKEIRFEIGRTWLEFYFFLFLLIRH
jgi:hypothetical protein